MNMVPLSHAKTHLARLLTEVQELGEELIITRSGRPAGVLVSYEEYEGLLETLEILADQDLSQSIAQGLREEAAGETVSHEELWRDLDDSLHD